MADTGKQSPLGQNVLGGLLKNRCLRINSNAEFFMGVSKSNSQYTYGKLVEGTVLRMLTWAINDGFTRGVISNASYNNLISIKGDASECSALGNSKPPTYIAVDPSGSWAGKTAGSADCKSVEFGVSQGVAGSLPGPANAGYSVTSDTDYGQQATWLPYNTTNANKSITQWGWIRCHALQAHNEFNYHAKEGTEGADLDSNPTPIYENFAGSFNDAYSFTQYTNKTVATAENAETFLQGTFANMDDLITGDVTGVSLYTNGLAYDLQNLQKIFDFKKLDRFGYPSTLLQQLHGAGGITRDLNLTLGSTGLSERDIRNLSTSITHGTTEQERKIYTAFLTITGKNLLICASSLTNNSYFLERCGNPNIAPSDQVRTLADLLDPWRLFLNARTTLTVPVYNTTVGLPTGTKTYYLIYNEDGSVNSAINTENVKEIIGTLITRGKPTIVEGDSKSNPSTELPIGFDSYLGGSNVVVPAKVGLSAAAVRYSFLQISNIEQLTPGELGDCLRFLETMQDVGDGANGTAANSEGLQKPINAPLIKETQSQMALGSNDAGQYRMDDFFGNMSGNPYNWRGLYARLAGDKEIQNVTADATTSNLAAIYQQLYLAVSREPATISPIYTGAGPYVVTGWTITNAGGGYGRGGAPDPDISFSDGLVGTCDIGRSDEDSGSTGTFGRVITITGATGTVANIPTATIETPPSGTYAWLPATGGTNGGTINFNTVTQYYIDAANNEITDICDKNPDGQLDLNTIWLTMGKQMKVEQRTRYNALGRVEVPRDPFIYTNQDLVSFVDSIPDYADYRTGRGARVTLELIVDRNCDVGQNIVAQLRQEGNEKALANCGIPINNNIPDTISPARTQRLVTNGTVPTAVEGVEIDGLNWVNPSWPYVEPPGGDEPQGPGGYDGGNGFIPTSKEIPGSYAPLYEGDPNPQIGPIVSVGPPDSIDIDTDSELGEWWVGSPYQPPPQDPSINSGGGRPAPGQLPFVPTQSTQEAIEKVIHCNCDCWDLIG